MLDFDYEIENSYRGSLMFNLSSIILFYEHPIGQEDRSWEGFRSIFSPGIGYRQYYLTFTTTKVNPKKHPVKFRNTPLNSISFYIQTMVSPAFKIAYDKKYKSADPKKGSIDVGIAPIRLDIVRIETVGPRFDVYDRPGLHDEPVRSGAERRERRLAALKPIRPADNDGWIMVVAHDSVLLSLFWNEFIKLRSRRQWRQTPENPYCAILSATSTGWNRYRAGF